jgi:hypothetical protein
MNSNHRKEKFDEDLEGEITSKIINIDQTITSKEALMNLMS